MYKQLEQNDVESAKIVAFVDALAANHNFCRFYVMYSGQ